ncbi:MAG: hypothetical protein WEF86_02890 [Gemmatimonadota bacterium]
MQFAFVVIRAPTEVAAPGFVVRTTDAAPGQAWYMCLHVDHASRRNVARALAVLQADTLLRFLPDILLPPQPPLAWLIPDGSFRDTMGDPLAAEYADEVERVTGLLLERHGAYVGTLAGIFKGQEPTAGFVRLEPSDPLYQEFPELPGVPVDTWRAPHPPMVTIRGKSRFGP